MKWVYVLYVFFVGIILSVTTGFGVAAFYPEPKAPQYPTAPFVAQTIPQSCYATPQAQNTPDCQAAFEKQEETNKKDTQAREEYDKQMQEFRNVSSGYTRTAVFFGISIGAIFAILGLALVKNSRMISAGLLLAGVLTAIFTRLLIGLASLGSSVRGTASPDNLAYVEFGILFVLSLLVIGVGLLRLSNKETSK